MKCKQGERNMPNKLIDGYERKIDYLRLSITDRCNLRCTYCMPEYGVNSLDRDQLLTYEELIRIIKILAGIGIKKIRLTGGEPLLRSNLISFISNINKVEGIENISLTTNGILLQKYAYQLYEAGVKGLNVSLDSLDQEKYKIITRGGNINKVIRGIDEIIGLGFDPIKINVVLTSMIEKKDIIDFINFSTEKSVIVRFIEMMPVMGLTDIECNKNISTPDNPLIKVEDIFSIIGEFGDYTREEKTIGYGPAVYYKSLEGRGKIGLILNEKSACSNCNRIRITPQGGIKLCLFSSQEEDLREIIRKGCPDEEIRNSIIDYIKAKPINREFNQINNNKASRISHFMSKIGG
jgi:cyclic pyranopterin phosphate synthase